MNVNKTSDPRVSNYERLHIRYRLTYTVKRELKPDHEIEKSIRYFNYHFLLLPPQPFQFFIVFTESVM